MSRLGSEDGAIVVFVAVVMLLMMAAAAMAVDAGSLWVARRGLVTATDASALAAASALAVGEAGCATQAGSYLIANASSAQLAGCTHTPGPIPATGFVTVNATQDVPFVFGPLVGVDGAAAASITAAQYGPPNAVNRVRPLAICVDSLAGWNPDSADVVKIGNSSACADASGNWGWLDFPGSASLSENIANGYAGTVRIGDQVAVRTGTPATLRSELEALVGQVVVFVVFNQASGCGANARYTVLDFIAAELVSVETPGGDPGPPGGAGPPENTGPPEDPGGCQGGNQGQGGGWDINVRAARILATGECCGTGSGVIDSGIRVMKICAVDQAGATSANCSPN